MMFPLLLDRSVLPRLLTEWLSLKEIVNIDSSLSARILRAQYKKGFSIPVDDQVLTNAATDKNEGVSKFRKAFEWVVCKGFLPKSAIFYSGLEYSNQLAQLRKLVVQRSANVDEAIVILNRLPKVEIAVFEGSIVPLEVVVELLKRISIIEVGSTKFTIQQSKLEIYEDGKLTSSRSVPEDGYELNYMLEKCKNICSIHVKRLLVGNIDSLARHANTLRHLSVKLLAFAYLYDVKNVLAALPKLESFSASGEMLNTELSSYLVENIPKVTLLPFQWDRESGRFAITAPYRGITGSYEHFRGVFEGIGKAGHKMRELVVCKDKLNLLSYQALLTLSQYFADTLQTVDIGRPFTDDEAVTGLQQLLSTATALRSFHSSLEEGAIKLPDDPNCAFYRTIESLRGRMAISQLNWLARCTSTRRMEVTFVTIPVVYQAALKALRSLPMLDTLIITGYLEHERSKKVLRVSEGHSSAPIVAACVETAAVSSLFLVSKHVTGSYDTFSVVSLFPQLSALHILSSRYQLDDLTMLTILEACPALQQVRIQGIFSSLTWLLHVPELSKSSLNEVEVGPLFRWRRTDRSLEVHSANKALVFVDRAAGSWFCKGIEALSMRLCHYPESPFANRATRSVERVVADLVAAANGEGTLRRLTVGLPSAEFAAKSVVALLPRLLTVTTLHLLNASLTAELLQALLQLKALRELTASIGPFADFRVPLEAFLASLDTLRVLTLRTADAGWKSWPWKSCGLLVMRLVFEPVEMESVQEQEISDFDEELL